MGVEVIIVDHHQVPEGPCEAQALLNPHQPGCTFPFKGLASVGVAFYLAGALRTRLRAAGWPHLPDLRDFLDLVAIGTIADLAPLFEENRVLVHSGLRELKRCQRPGLRALCEIVGLDEGPTCASDVAFRLAPRLNAPGRLGDAAEALSLLIETDQRRARGHAETCNDLNTRRQEVQEVVLREAREQVEAQLRNLSEGQGPEVLVVGARGWHAGVVGIVAAKLVDLYSRPSVVIAFEDEVGRGSARSAHQFHMYQGLQSAAPLLLRYGGHAAAAGLSLHEDKLAALRDVLCDSYRRQLGGQPLLRDTTVDTVVSLDEVDERLASEISLLEPFGIGNPEPLLLVRDAEVVRHKVVGSGHLQVTLRTGSTLRDAIGFGLGHRSGELMSGARLQAAFVPEIDTHRGLRKVRLRLRELQAGGDLPAVKGSVAV
jgi:single-stranded-DNA-specific exonuclease